MGNRIGWCLALLVALCGVLAGAERPSMAQERIFFDWTGKTDTEGWEAQHDISALTPTPDGLKIAITGSDPYLAGPPKMFPIGQTLWLTIKLKAEQAGMAQVFYFKPGSGPDEAHSVRFAVKGGAWETLKVPMPPLGPEMRLRFDPPGDHGTVVLASMEFTNRTIYAPPAFPKPVPPDKPNGKLKITSGDLTVTFDGKHWGGFVVDVAGKRMATGLTNPLIGYLKQGKPVWIDVAKTAKVTLDLHKYWVLIVADLKDADGGKWRCQQEFNISRTGDGISVSTSVQVDRKRDIIWLPLFTLLAGAGSFGETKQQAIFGGLEYLDKNEPSRSEADIIGPDSHRQLPEDYKITLPLMAVQQEGHYIGLTWYEDSDVSAIFDSPDRIFHSGGHLLSLQFPGVPQGSHAAGALLPYTATTLPANEQLDLTCYLVGGKGNSVVPAIQQVADQWVLPFIPTPYPKWEDAARLMEAGWLDSADHKDGVFKHALPGSFPYQWAADAGVWLDYLASQTTNKAEAGRMRAVAALARKDIPISELNSTGIGHVRYPVPALVYGATAENAEHAVQYGHALLRQFEPDGTIHYHKPTDGRPDLGKTHFAPDANGLTAQVVAGVLEAAKFSGDKELTQEGLRVLHGLDKFANTVPRGAQTWEVPLHTPDILAAAYLVKAYTLGYELSGDKSLLDSATYWAWTGVPFIYLRNPVGLAVGPYATVPVLGATQWVAPTWIGLPVQWCGMVYADALRLLAKQDGSTFWTRLADGITASGLQQTFPIGSDKERVGLLPDSYTLLAQARNDPAINPATLLSGLPSLYKRVPIYDSFVSPNSRVIVHAPGRITQGWETAIGVTFKVEGWPPGEYDILLVGLTHKPQVFIDGKEVPLTAPNRYMEKEGRLVLHVAGQPTIRVQ